VTLVNRGINGGTSLDIRDGREGVQDPFAVVISNDQPDVVVLFIGINDIWWAGTSDAAYEQALRDIVSQAEGYGIGYFVLASPWLHYEKPDGNNPDDPKIETFTTICSNVAADTGVTFTDLRHLGIAYLQNHNYELRLDGSLVFREYGVLTYDGVHATGIGNEYLAEWLSYGISVEMGIPEPAGMALAVITGLLLMRR
jgi:lysophospholipase L1-like esterase